MSDWRDVPDWALAQQRQQDEARSWADQQYLQLAQDWASRETAQVQQQASQYSADDLYWNPQLGAQSASPEAAAGEPASPPQPAQQMAPPPTAAPPADVPSFTPPGMAPVDYAGGQAVQPAPFAGGDPNATRTSQFGLGLSYEDASAFCGPAAAMALAARYGNNIPVEVAKQEAIKVGWTNAAGMAGIGSQQKLLQNMGIATHVETNVDWAKVAKDADNGNPVTISTPGHYFYIQADPSTGRSYDPRTGKYFVGTSGTDLRAGSAWMSPAEIQAYMGKVQGALFVDNPAAPGPSRAGKSDDQWYDIFAQTASAISQGVQGAASQVGQAIGDAGNAIGQTLGPQPMSTAPVQDQVPQYVKDWAAVHGSQVAENPYAGQEPAPANPTTQNPLDVAGKLAQPMLPQVGEAVRNSGLWGPSDQTLQTAQDAVGKRIFQHQSLTPEEEQALRDSTMYVGGMVAPMGGGTGMPGAGKVASAAAEAAADAPHGLTINLPKYIPDEVQQVIRDAYDANPQVMDEARRGVMTDEAVKQLADATGDSVSNIVRRWRPGQAQNAETVFALREGLNRASQDVLSAQEALRAAPESADALNRFAQALTQHAAVQEAVTGVSAEAGRTLRQFRQPVTGSQASLKVVQRLAKNAQMTPEELAAQLGNIDLTDTSKVANLARTLTTHSFGDKLQALWYFNLLSSPTTHIKNTVSNALVVASRPVESAVAAPIDVARVGISRAMGRTAERERFAGEVPAQVSGTIAGVQDGLKGAWDILRRGYSDAEVTAKIEAAAKEPFKGQVSVPLRRGDVWGAAQGVGGNIVNAPSRALRASDVLFRSMNKYSTLYSEAFRLAKMEGLKGDALVERVTQLRANPTEQMLARAEKEAAYRVFQQDGDFVRWAGQKPAALKAAVPFVQTPYNIAKYALERTPLAAVKIGQEGLTGQLAAKGGGDLSDRLARIVTGTALMGSIWAYANEGNVTAAAPSDPAERDAFYRQGKQPYSMRTPDGQWHSYAGLQPFTTVIAAGAIASDLTQRGRDQDAATLLGMTTFGVARSLLDQPWTDGISQLMDFMSGSNVRDPEDAFKAARDYSERQASSVVPGVMRWLARAADNVVRDPEGPIEAIQAVTPGLSGNVPPRLDAMGNPSKRAGQGLETLSPFVASQDSQDPVETELARLQAGKFKVEPGFVGKAISVAGQQVQLNREQRAAYQKAAGALTYGLLLDLVTSPDWAGLPDAVKARVIDNVVNRSREIARAQMTPELIDQVINQPAKKAS